MQHVAYVERVLNLALEIGEALGADLEIITYAAYLHDIAHGEEINENEHAVKGTEIGKKILDVLNVQAENQTKVLETIRLHSIEEIDKLRDGPIESLALFLADKLDGLGAIGIARIFSEAGRRNRTILDTIFYIQSKYLSQENRVEDRIQP